MNLWGSYKKEVLKACDELCGKTARNEMKKVIAKSKRRKRR